MSCSHCSLALGARGPIRQPDTDYPHLPRLRAFGFVRRRHVASNVYGLSLDVLACVCGGRREVIALIERAAVIEKILNHLGMPSEPPVFHRPRPPPDSCPQRPAVSDDPWDEPDPEYEEDERWPVSA